MSKRRGVAPAIALIVTGLVTASFAADPPKAHHFRDPAFPDLLPWLGTALGAAVACALLVAGGVLFALGLRKHELGLRGHEPSPGALSFVSRDGGPLLVALSVLPLWLGVASAPTLGHRLALLGLRGDLILGALFGIAMTAVGLLGVLGRRTVVLDPTAREVRVSWGKPIGLLRWRHRFDEYVVLRVEVVKLRRGLGHSHWIYAGAEDKRPLLLAEARDAETAERLAREMAQMTGWVAP